MPVGGNTEKICSHNKYFRSLLPTRGYVYVVDLGQKAMPSLYDMLPQSQRSPGEYNFMFGKLHSALVKNDSKCEADPIAQDFRPWCKVSKNNLPLSALTLTFKITFSVCSSKIRSL